jgi:homoserine kinase type II
MNIKARQKSGAPPAGAGGSFPKRDIPRLVESIQPPAGAGGFLQRGKVWVVYILRCADDSLYTGMTNNIGKRFAAHNEGKAAKYTRSRRPVKLLTTSTKMDRGDAMRLEIKVKKLPKLKKIDALEKHITRRSSATGKKSKSRIHARKEAPLFSKETLKAVVELWPMRLKKPHYNIPIQGSPERSVFRVVLEDKNVKYFVLEQIPLKSLKRKRQIAATLDFLSKKNIARIQPYLSDEKGKHIIKYKNGFWQMTPFVRGIPLDREKYMYEKWRGPALADFLIELRRETSGLPFIGSSKIFSLKDYVYKLIREINLYNKDIKNEIKDVAGFLEKDFMPAYERLPVAFCHGDYHPMNIIWSADDIKCVIDWEFSGYKSDIYDAANLIGCIGVEDPQSLTGDLVKSFITDMKSADIITKISWKNLMEFIVALRFAWLSEWLRRSDTEMIRLELDYMRLLIENKSSLQKAWI